MRNRIRELRKAHGLTMKKFGSIFGLAESTISQYETGKRDPDLATLTQIADYFGVTLEYLLHLDSAANKSKYRVIDLFEGVGGRGHLDDLKQVDIDFYSDYAELSEADKETVRIMVNIMRGRSKKEPPQE